MRRFSETLIKSLNHYHPIPAINTHPDESGIDHNDEPLSPAESAAISNTTSTFVSPISPSSINSPFATSSPASPTSLYSGSNSPTTPEFRYWRDYAKVRPRPSRSFFDLIYSYHCNSGTGKFGLAHDVGTGPGLVASGLAAEFETVVASDPNPDALASAQLLIRKDRLPSIRGIRSSAEGLSSHSDLVGSTAKSDMIIAAQCIDLMDVSSAFESFQRLLKPGGTLVIWYTGRPIFRGWDGAQECNEAFERLARELCRRSEPDDAVRQAVGLIASGLDGVMFPRDVWRNVERHQWNGGNLLLPNDPEAFEATVLNTSWPRLTGELRVDHGNVDVWLTLWKLGSALRYLESYYPCKRMLRENKTEVVEALLRKLEAAFGGPHVERVVHWPIVLLLAVKR